MTAPVRNLRLVIAYDGADFAGWQRQDGLRTVQGDLEQVIGAIEGAPVHVAAAGRTDSGAHAAAQVASVKLTADIAPARLVRACNATLQPDVRLLAAEEMPDDFHARIHARGKTYRYFVWHAPSGAPSLRRTSWHVPQRLDLAAMQAAAAHFVGEHDFAAFQAQGSDVQTTVRRIWRSVVDVAPPPPGWCSTEGGGRLLAFEVAGTGFLRHQVRVMAGTLVLVGKGRLTPAAVPEALASGSRAAAGPTAPPYGLHLWQVHYTDDSPEPGSGAAAIADPQGRPKLL